MKEPINILCGLDEAYVQHGSVMLSSLFRSTPNAAFRVFLLIRDLPDQSLNRIRYVCAKYGQEFVPIASDRKDLADAPLNTHISTASYLRLIVAQLLPTDIDRVLYLDSDLIVRSDIRPLYNVDLGNNLIAAIPELQSREQNERLGMDPDMKYFNSGVLLINLKLWREEQTGEQALKFAIEHQDQIKWGDQDALNATVKGRVRYGEAKWNAGGWMYIGLPLEQLGLDAAELEQALKNPCIVHYTGSEKPWAGNGNKHPFRQDYFHHLRRTPYFGPRHIAKRLCSLGPRLLNKLRPG